MARVRENWSRLVNAAVPRHQATGLAAAAPPSRTRTTNIETILEVAVEIQDQNPNVARILREQAYDMAGNTDPSSEGRGVLQFKTGLTCVITQKLCLKGGSRIDRSNDIEHMWEFYQLYKQNHRVEEEKWQQSGVFSTNMTESMDMRNMFATLRVLIEAMEWLSTDNGTRISIMVMEEVKRFRFTGGLTPFDMAPLDSPPFTNAVGVFPEVIPSLVSTSDHIHATTLRDPTSHSDWNAPNPPHSNASSSGWALSESSTSHPQTATVLPSAPPLPYSDWPIYYPSIDATPLEVSMRNEAPNPTESKDEDENMCVICCDSPVEGACIPCGHMAGCMSCLNQIKSSKRDCPVCRAEISQVVRIYAV